MPMFSALSRERLFSCHPDLQLLFNEVVKEFDCTVIIGHRDKKEQNEAVNKGSSTKFWPNSMHNSLPSLAVDVSPYPIDWKNTKRFYFFAGYVLGIAAKLNIKIRWGGDWDGDNDLDDQKLFDLVHFELSSPLVHVVASAQG